jgi:hypothetical protein
MVAVTQTGRLADTSLRLGVFVLKMTFLFAEGTPRDYSLGPWVRSLRGYIIIRSIIRLCDACDSGRCQSRHRSICHEETRT